MKSHQSIPGVAISRHDGESVRVSQKNVGKAK